MIFYVCARDAHGVWIHKMLDSSHIFARMHARLQRTRRYPLTFIMAFIWVALFSFTISTVVDQWVDKAPATADYLSVIFGVILVAGGAEIPDTLQSVLYARQG